ncbi:MAG: glutathione S-transferase family protein [Casimicrobium sp.]
MSHITTIWGRRTSLNVQKVLWTLDELDVEYERRNAGGSFGGLEAPEFLAMNPNGLVPVLRDEQGSIWESNAIVRYLCAKHSPDDLWLSEPYSRSLADRWIDWAGTTLQQNFMRLFWGYYRTPALERDPQDVQQWLNRCQRNFRILDTHLAKHDFLAGSRFTIADIPAGATLHRYFEMGLPVERPTNVLAWFARLNERPAYRANIVQPFNELYGRLAF